MKNEPCQHRSYWVLLILCALGTIPLPFVGSELKLWAGFPVWLWWSMGFTLLLSIVCFWGIVNLWQDSLDD